MVVEIVSVNKMNFLDKGEIYRSNIAHVQSLKSYKLRKQKKGEKINIPLVFI